MTILKSVAKYGFIFFIGSALGGAFAALWPYSVLYSARSEF
jgi:hypothetical protein